VFFIYPGMPPPGVNEAALPCQARNFWTRVGAATIYLWRPAEAHEALLLLLFGWRDALRFSLSDDGMGFGRRSSDGELMRAGLLAIGGSHPAFTHTSRPHLARWLRASNQVRMGCPRIAQTNQPGVLFRTFRFHRTRNTIAEWVCVGSKRKSRHIVWSCLGFAELLRRNWNAVWLLLSVFSGGVHV